MDEGYYKLLKSYHRMLGMVDSFHFNSQNTADVFCQYLDIPKSSKVVSITHSGIGDHRKKKKYDEELLKLGFIGSEAPYKGLPLLKNVIEKINKEGYFDRIELQVYGGRTGKDEYLNNVIYKGKFEASEMGDVYNKMDVLVVPSIWNETFSLVTLEALSYGTIVLVSDKVGAKDIVKQYSSNFVFKSKKELYDILKTLVEDRSLMYEYQDSLMSNKWDYSMNYHSKSIVDELY